MAKLRNPLFSLRAHGSLNKLLAFRHRHGTTIAEKRPYPKDAKTSAQLAWRTMYQLAVDLWHALSAAEKQEWESLGTARHMTGFAWFMSQALRPNPGIYLPLLGGTMQGDINMDTHDILGNFSCPGKSAFSVYLSGAQVIPTFVPTTIQFDTESFDILSEFDSATNYEFTAKKAGIYLILAIAMWDTDVNGIRSTSILKNGFSIANDTRPTFAGAYPTPSPSVLDTLSAGDKIKFQVFQTSGGNINLISGTGATIAGAIKIA